MDGIGIPGTLGKIPDFFCAELPPQNTFHKRSSVTKLFRGLFTFSCPATFRKPQLHLQLPGQVPVIPALGDKNLPPPVFFYAASRKMRLWHSFFPSLVLQPHNQAASIPWPGKRRETPDISLCIFVHNGFSVHDFSVLFNFFIVWLTYSYCFLYSFSCTQNFFHFLPICLVVPLRNGYN